MAKIIRRAIAVLLVVTAILLMLVPSGDVQAVSERGDYIMDGGTLVSYKGSEANLTLPNTITTIGKDAFSGNDKLVSVNIPDSVTTIDYAAFENCRYLQKVSIPESVRTIGSSAFSGCTSLNSVNIPGKVDNIGSAVFAMCPSLSSISVSPSNKNFTCLDGVLYTKDGRKLMQYLAGRPYTQYIMPDTVKDIEEFAFYGANNLTGVSISSGVKNIPEYAFMNCVSLSDVEIPSSVESIYAGAFGGCPSLKKLAVPSSVGYIDDAAFTSLDGVTSSVKNSSTGEMLSIGDDDGESKGSGTVAAATQQSMSSNTGPGAEGSVSENSAPASDTSANRKDSLKTTTQEGRVPGSEDFTDNLDDEDYGTSKIVGGSAVFIMSPDMPVKGFDIEAGESEDTAAGSGSDFAAVSDKEYEVNGDTFASYNRSEEKVSIPAGLSKVGNRAFYNNKSVKEVDIPKGTKSIGDFAFARSSLEGADIPEGTEEIGYAAFYHCTELSDISIPSSVKDIELGAFEGTKWLKDWKSIEDGNDFLIVGDGILLSYKGFGGSITIPEGVKVIAPGCFLDNSTITGVSFPSSLTKIGEDAFDNCYALSRIDLPSSLREIEDRAFKNTGLKNVTIPANVSSIGLGAFDTKLVNGGLESVTLLGNSIPDVSYKPTASRLSASDLRTLAFNGTDTAIINEGANLKGGNLFDTDEYGFRGGIYSIKEAAKEGKSGLAELVRVTYQPDKNGNVTIDPDITADGRDYKLSGVRKSAFDEYDDQSWCSTKVSSISVNGNLSGELKSLINSVDLEKGAKKTADGISLSYDRTLFNGEANAKIPGNSDNFRLSIERDEDIRDDMMSALKAAGESYDPSSLIPLDISMTDELGAIPINRFSNSKLEISLPLPSQVSDPENLAVITLDDNGMPEKVSSLVSMDEDGSNARIDLVASHLSPFAIYTKTLGSGEEGEAFDVTEDESLSGIPVITGTVKTLTKKADSIENKWFVIVILLAVSAILFLYKDRKKIKERQ